MAEKGDVFPQRNLPGLAENWGRQVEDRIVLGEKSESQLEQKVDNGLRATAGQLSVLSNQINSLIEQQELLLSFSQVQFDSFNDIRQVPEGSWMSNPPTVQLLSPTGRVEISFGGSANNGGTIFVYQIVGSTSGTIVSRGSILTNMAERVAVSGGATFYPSGYTTLIVNVPRDELLTISMHAFADNAFPDVYISGGRILARVAP